MTSVRRPPYSYLELAEACSALGLQNVYAVVAECSVPRPTKGTDYVSNLLLMDPSTDGLQRPVEMLVFAKLEWQLPHLHKPGDIIRLHRVKAQTYNDKPQFIGKLGASSGPFSFCLFDADHAAGTTPYQHSHQSYHWDEREGQILDALRQYVATSDAYHLAPRTDYVKTIKGLEAKMFVDLVCKVLAYGEAGGPGWRVMFVWDGTDALPYPYRDDIREVDGGRVPPEVHHKILSLSPLPLPLEGSQPAELRPLLGTALPVVFQVEGEALGAALPDVGSWVKLRNVGIRVVQGQVQGYYTHKSKWAPWQEEADAVRAYQHRLQHNEMAGWAPTNPDQLLTRSLHPEQPFTSLRRILMDAPTGIPHCYRALVRAVDYTPHQPAEMCHTVEECGLAPGMGGIGASGPQYVYTLKLLLEDATGQLDAILFGPDAAVFFKELPACNLVADAEGAAQVEDRLERLLGKECGWQGGPWMDVCLKAYYNGDPRQPWKSRQYMIFDTELTAASRPPARGV